MGTVLHHVAENLAEGRWAAATDATTAACELFETAVEDLERKLKEHPQLATRVPIRSCLGRNRYVSGREKLERIARNIRIRKSTVAPEPLPDLLRPFQAASKVPSCATAPTPGVEVGVCSPKLRLLGRIDRLTEAHDVIEVIEYKTGSILDRDDNIYLHHQQQLGMYALMLESAFPKQQIRLYIEGDDRYEVEWNQQVRSDRLQELEELDARLPTHGPLAARELGAAGQHCERCSLRPCCSVYQDHAQAAWTNSDLDYLLPADVWGRIENLETYEGKLAWRIRDAAGRRVRIAGVGASRYSHCKPDDYVYLFDLKRHGSPPRHKRFAHPAGFYIDIPGMKPAHDAFVYHSPS